LISPKPFKIPDYVRAQIVKSSEDLLEENVHLAASLQGMRRSPKTAKLLAKLNSVYQLNRQILQARNKIVTVEA
jgi:hypothetical protein